ncbi:MAG: ParB N-terminal domain-containing protein [Bacteroidaceae bacterium]|nr:ParB N-terminal domain-containing protein [Bacteroidaceae bacterium]
MKPKAQVEYRPIKDLKELPGNPRIIKKDQFEKLKTSIKDNADYFEARPIILSDRTGELVILAGNQRYKAAKAIGMAEVPTILLPNLTEEREKEIIIRDNVENGDWDMDILANEWDAAELEEWGVDVPEVKLPEDQDAVTDADLDASEIIIASASIYGQNGDIILADKIPQADAEKILPKIEKAGPEMAMAKIMEALNAL